MLQHDRLKRRGASVPKRPYRPTGTARQPSVPRPSTEQNNQIKEREVRRQGTGSGRGQKHSEGGVEGRRQAVAAGG
jgi:hypothetical protein